MTAPTMGRSCLVPKPTLPWAILRGRRLASGPQYWYELRGVIGLDRTSEAPTVANTLFGPQLIAAGYHSASPGVWAGAIGADLWLRSKQSIGPAVTSRATSRAHSPGDGRERLVMTSHRAHA